MCGICGIVNLNSVHVDANQVLRMMDVLGHRGPDDAGVFVQDNVALGNRRLSIIDLAGSRQPMSNEDGTVWVSYNGEIYNYQELRRLLIGKGHTFKTEGDTEVIVHLYEEFQERMPDELNGMYALAIWDRRKRRLFLLRDRLGIKPLYYSVHRQVFLFASEAKSILAYEGFESRVNAERIEEYLTFGSIPGEETLFQNIFQLLPGHMIVVEDSSLKSRRYWDIQFDEIEANTLDSCPERLDTMLRESVRMELVSDVPVGALLSGGIDSSLVVHNMARLTHPVRTFTAGFPGKEYDESEWAGIVARKLKTQHHEVVVNSHNFFEALPRLIWHNDEPIVHPSSVPIYFLARLAKEHGVKVLFSGEGADEMLAGYGSYPAYVRDARLTKIVPTRLASLLMLVVNPMVKPRLLKFVERYTFSEEELLKFHISPNFRAARSLVATEPNCDSFFERYYDQVKNLNPLLRISYLNLKIHLASLLTRLDKMTMAASVEGRVPYLDHRLVEFSQQLPFHLKLSEGTGKAILRKVGREVLPESIVTRQKVGFRVPLDEWLRHNHLVSLVGEADRPYLRKKEISRILNEYSNGNDGYAPVVWSLLNLEIWTRIFVEKEDF